MAKKLRVLVACEFSGVVRNAFIKKGHDAWSCDFLQSEFYGPHYWGNVLRILNGWLPVMFAGDCIDDICPVCNIDYADCAHPGPTQDGIEYKEFKCGLFGRPINHRHWDLMIAHPPCTYLCSSGLHWNKRVEGRAEKTEEALDFIVKLMNAPIKKICLENPIGCISSRIRKPDQIIQPFEYGHLESKQTCLWLKNLPLLQPTKIMKKPESGRWSNQTPTGQNKLGPSENRWKERSRTYEGIGTAMAEQWG